MSNTSEHASVAEVYRRAFDSFDYERFAELASDIHNFNKYQGFWDDGPHNNKGTKIGLMHSELSEALEGLRKDAMDDHLKDRKSEEVELADAIIRILDYAAGYGLDIAGALQDKLSYNTSRPFKHGKKF